MAGEPLEYVEIGVHSLISALRKNSHAVESVYLSIITFDAKAKILVPLSEIPDIVPPSLKIRPGTAMGAALELVYDSINREVVKSTGSVKGDFRPLIFILTDGQPTDDWQAAVRRLKNMGHRPANIYAIGCGDEIDFTTMYQIADTCLHMKGLSPQSLSDLFVWLSASVQTQSMSVTPDEPLSLDKIPLKKDIVVVDRANPPRFTQNPRLYFHVRCTKTKKHYLMRYRFIPEQNIYVAENSVPLPEDFFSDGTMKTPPISVNQLYGSVDCPYCDGNDWAKCGFCGHLFCINNQNLLETVICPNCESKLTLSESSSTFSVDGSQG
jgi:uncharacterized protein YegL